MRNNSGALKDSNGRLIYYGLGNISSKHSKILKSSDLIGIRSVLITPDMVGKTIGVFTALEVKREGWKRKANDPREIAQSAFLNLVKARGGIASFISSIDELESVMKL